MEKATKKRKKSKRLRRRIGLIAIGGMSLMLTVCLSVGATLAWFAGSTWASDDMYMGGPVYVEMAGRGHTSGTTTGDGTNTASWQGGNGTLDIMASSRSTGTASTATDKSNILLPGQKLLIYSQARVFSTAYTSSVGTTTTPNQSSGANTTNSSSENGMATYNTGKGRVVTTTTSVLRARFTINVEFDPYMGFNNFTDVDYAAHYPVQSAVYTGETGEKLTASAAIAGRDNIKVGQDYYALASNLPWEGSLGAASIGTANGRRDAVTTGNWLNGKTGSAGAETYSPLNIEAGKDKDLGAIKNGTKKAVYEWKYVSLKEYKLAGDAPAASGDSYVKMGAPFDGTVNSIGEASNTLGPSSNYAENTSGTGNGYYGVWVCKEGKYLESASYYKARTTAYMNSYKEHYKDDYNRQLVLTVTNSLSSLENALNEAFEGLVNESSDNILTGNTDGFKVDVATGQVTHNAATDGGAHLASWLYVDPAVGNDTNAGDSSTQKGGWWYLVANKTGTTSVSGGNDTIITETDALTKGGTAYDGALKALTTADSIVHTNTPGEVLRKNVTNDNVLTAKLYEITPDINAEILKSGDGGVTKIVSDAFPFVNGDFELPGRELTNIFANAKITFQISFQALQAFFPYTPSIDGIASGTAITGTGKALNIGNAIPIFNEAFDYLTVL
ncbi:MAG: hypothetical protein E7356_05235 [Clostridiales bacterium]|nr:hypothetical protein [Clostridiales bacterium]